MDKGRVYVDCTGTEGTRGELDSFDKIAYVEAGKEYGLISSSYTHSPDYEYYDIKKNKKVKGFYRSPGVTKSSEIYWEMDTPGNYENKPNPTESEDLEKETGAEEGDKLGQVKDSFTSISEEIRI